MPRPLNEQVVVLTGASSGIGRQTALDLTSRGAMVVGGARNLDALQSLQREVTAAGGIFHPVMCDVANLDDVVKLADEAVGRFGRIDTWVNNAGISVYGLVEDIDIAEIERVIQVDVMGVIYGCKVAIPHMKLHGGGTIINIGSAISARAVPLQAPYSAAKHAVKGFTEALRMEMEHEKTGIDVTLILPASINTPFFENARSKMDVMAKPIPPVYEATAVSQAIVAAAESPKRDVHVGLASKMMTLTEGISPSLMDTLMLAGGAMFKQQQSDQPPPAQDNLFTPTPGLGTTTGQWGTLAQPTSLYTRFLELHPNQQRLLVGAALAGALLLARSSDRMNA